MLRSRLLIVSLLIVTIVALAACGGPSGTASNKPVDVQITLSEFKIDSSLTTFNVGTPYHFTIHNAGTVNHEWEIMPRGDSNLSDALIMVGQQDLPAGATVTRDFTFTKAGDFEFACHLPGHYEAGMHTPITVK